MRDDLKVGVFLCECGGNIADVVDLDEVRTSLDVEFIGQFENLCSLNGRKLIRDAIFDHDLDRVVVAACSPISHEKTFQDYVKPLNPYLMDMANIREQCSWVHDDKDKATRKAITLINASIEKVKQSDAVDPIYCQTPDEVAVIGGGNTAMDSVRTAKRLGAERAMIIYRRSEAEMPARLEEVKHAKEEGIEFLTLHNPLEYIADEKGAVKQVVLQKMELGEPDASGRRSPVAIPGATVTLDIDMAVVAVGVSPNPIVPTSIKGLELGRKNTIAVNEKMQSSIPTIFAGGDIVRGGATVILAMGDGRRAAQSMHEYLSK